MTKIKLIPVLVVAALYWILGGIWYSPLLFANKFIALMGWTPQQVVTLQQAGESQTLIVAFINSLVLAFILAHFVRYTKANNVVDGLKTGFWLWLGFVVTTNLETVLFEQRALGLYLINNSYHLVGILMMGAILAVWGNQPAEEEYRQRAVNSTS
jgi:hypothetical protein